MNLFNSIVLIAFLIFLGFVLKKYLIVNEKNWQRLDTLVYYFLLPSLIISKLASANFDLSLILAIVPLISACLIIIGLLFAIKLIFKIDNALFTSAFQGSIRFNTYIYFAITLALFGENALTFAIIIASVMILFFNLCCVLVLSIYHPGSKNMGHIVLSLSKNPLIFSVLVGMFFSWISIPITPAIKLNTDTLAFVTLSCSLIAVGGGLRFRLNKDRWLVIALACFIKLIVLPVVSFLFLRWFGVVGIIGQIALLQSLNATAPSGYILARQMGGDSEAIASIITFTTLLSIFTIPVVLALTKLWVSK